MPNQTPSLFQDLTQGFIYSGHMTLYLIQGVRIHGGVFHLDYTCGVWKKIARYSGVRQQWTPRAGRLDKAVPWAHYMVWVFPLKCHSCYSILESTKMGATCILISGRYKDILKGFLHSRTRCDVVYWHDLIGGSFELVLLLMYLLFMGRWYTLHQSSLHHSPMFHLSKIEKLTSLRQR